MTKEYDTIAALWLSFYQLMHNSGQDDEATEEQQPSTEGHFVSTKQSSSSSINKND